MEPEIEMAINDLIECVIDEAKDELAKAGIFFDVCYPEVYGNSFSSIVLKGVSVELENSLLSEWLSKASSSWEKVYKAIALKHLMGGKANLFDYVWVEDIYWSDWHGPIVRLCISDGIRELLNEFGLGDVDADEMESAIEGILRDEAREITRKLNEELVKLYKEHASHETLF